MQVVGIRFSDNDFWETCKTFVELFIVPTMIEREEGHFITHLTSSQIVELFNTHAVYLYKFLRKQEALHIYKRDDNITDEEFQSMKEYLVITEQDVYWGGKTDDYINKWDEWNNFEFFWCNGKRAIIS